MVARSSNSPVAACAIDSLETSPCMSPIIASEDREPFAATASGVPSTVTASYLQRQQEVDQEHSECLGL